MKRTLTKRQASLVIPWLIEDDPEPDGIARALTDQWLSNGGPARWRDVQVHTHSFTGTVDVIAPPDRWRYALSQTDFAGLHPTATDFDDWRSTS